MRRGRLPWPAATVALAAALTVAVTSGLASCSVGPSSRPPLATIGEPPTTAGAAAPTSPALGPGGVGQQAQPLKWGSCPRDIPSTSTSGVEVTIDCSSLRVPVTRDGTTDRTTQDLQIARARTADTPADAPVLVVVLGEPGEFGTARIADVTASVPQKLRARFQVVTLDLRGTPGSWDGKRCFGDNALTDLLSPPVDASTARGADLVDSISKDIVFECADTERTRITDIGTTAAADDLDTLRAALGTDTLTFLGRGAGATLGAVWAHRYPARVARLVLDAPDDPLPTAAEVASTRAAALERALTSFADNCSSQQDRCPLGDDPRARVVDLVRELGDNGSTTNHSLVTGGSVLLVLAQRLGDPAGWPKLTQALAAATHGDVTQVADLLDTGARDARGDDLLEPRLEYRCNDSRPRLSGDPLREAAAAAKPKAPLFGAFMVGQAGLCGAWPSSTTPLGRLSGAGAAPILVAAATGDPVAPYAGAQSVSRQLASASLITWQSGTHGSVPASSCVSGAVAQYLTGGTLPPPGRLCPP